MNWIREIEDHQNDKLYLRKRQLAECIEREKSRLEKFSRQDGMITRLMKELGDSGIFRRKDTGWAGWLIESNLRWRSKEISEAQRLLRADSKSINFERISILLRSGWKAKWTCGYRNSHKPELAVTLSETNFEDRPNHEFFHVEREKGSYNYCDCSASESSLKKAIAECLADEFTK
jgi:hypothetical protein